MVPLSPRLIYPMTASATGHGGGCSRRTIKVAVGTVKWFNPTKGYGFISPTDGQSDVFVHISAVERAGLATLNEGQRVEYELARGNNGKFSAVNLKVG
jgi:CspA family cold shock protein